MFKYLLLAAVILSFLWAPQALQAQVSITSNDGGTALTTNLNAAVTSINGITGGGSITLAISGSESVSLNQALPVVSQSVTLVGTSGTDQGLTIVAQNEAEGAVTFSGNLTANNGVSFSLTNNGFGGSGQFDTSIGAAMITLGNNDSMVFSGGTTAGFSGIPGGSAAVSATAINLTGNSDQFSVTGGAGSSTSSGAPVGGNAWVSVGNVTLSGASDTFSVTGGAGGADSNSVGGVGGAANVTIGSLLMTNSSDIFSVTGGNSALFGSAGANSSYSGVTVDLSGTNDLLSLSGTAGQSNQLSTGISGGNGGSASATITEMFLTGSAVTLKLSAGAGGQGSVGTNGNGGNGGSVTLLDNDLILSNTGDVVSLSGAAGNISNNNGGTPKAAGLGGNAIMSAANDFTMSGISDLVTLVAGNGAAGNTITVTTDSGGAGGLGGSALVTVGDLTLSNTQDMLKVQAGNGGVGGGAFGGGVTTGAGGNGGTAFLQATGAAVLSGSGDSVSVTGGTGGTASNTSSSSQVGGVGGNGGSSTLSFSSLTLSGSGNSLNLTGGNGGNGGNTAGVLAGNGGSGASVSLTSNLVSLAGSNNGVTLTGGTGGNGGYESDNSGSVTSGGGGIGGSEAVTLGDVVISGANDNFVMLGGVGGSDGNNTGTSATNYYGVGGTGGALAVSIIDLTLSNTQDVFEMIGGNAGSASTTYVVTNGIGGTGGLGGSAVLALGTMQISGDQVGVTIIGGNGGNGGISNNGGPGGAGGIASLTTNTLNMSGFNDNFILSAGNGGEAGGDFTFSAAAGIGGSAAVTVGSLTLSGDQETLTVTGGTGGVYGTGNSSSSSGAGGSASVTATTMTLSGTGESLNLAGGAAGGVPVGYTGGTIGSGGSVALNVATLNIGSGNSLSIVGGAGGTVGSATLTTGVLNGGGSVSLYGNGSTLQVNSGDFTGVISGNEAFFKSTTGTLILDGVNTYTGSNYFNGGTLVVGSQSGTQAQMPGDVGVPPGSTLQGFGKVTGLLTNDGIVQPGNGTAGTLTVGNYTQSTGGTLLIGLTPAGSNSLNVLGTTSLGGALTVTTSGNFGLKYTYNILTSANAIPTQFGSYNISLPTGFGSTLSYGANAVTLTLTRNNADFTSFSQNANETAVASALNSAVSGASGDLLTKMNALYTMSSGQAAALQQMSGLAYTALPSLAVENAHFETDLLMDHLDGVSSGSTQLASVMQRGPWAALGGSDADPVYKKQPSRNYWIEQTDSFGSVNATSAVSAFNKAAYGVLGGYESQGADGFDSGFAVGYNHTDLNSQGLDGTAGIDGWQGDLFAKYNFDTLQVEAILGYGFNQYSTTRALAVGSTATGSFTGNQITASLRANDDISSLLLADMKPLLLVGIDYTYVNTGNFTETGAASLDLVEPAESVRSLRPYVGAGVAPKFKEFGLTFEPVGRVTFGFETLTQPNSLQAAFSGAPDNSFTVAGVTPDGTLVGVEAGLGAQMDQHTKLWLGYNGDFSGSQNLNTISGGVDLSFQ